MYESFDKIRRELLHLSIYLSIYERVCVCVYIYTYILKLFEIAYKHSFSTSISSSSTLPLYV